MSLAELPGTIDYLTDAAHLLRMTAPETSAHLMSQRNSLLSLNGIPSGDIQRQHVCGACGHIMIPGCESTLKIEARKALRRKKTPSSKHKSIANKIEATHARPSSPVRVVHCGNCQRDTKIGLSPPGPATRAKAAMPSKVKKATASEVAKMTANASSKKRAKNRKAGLQALLSGQQQKSSSPLSLASFMK